VQSSIHIATEEEEEEKREKKTSVCIERYYLFNIIAA